MIVIRAQRVSAALALSLGAACVLLLACSSDRGERGGGDAPPAAGSGSGGSDPGLDLGETNPPPDTPGRAGSGARPSGCVNEGEINEFGLPICDPPPGADSGVPPDMPDCELGFDDLGRPLCVGDGGMREPPPPPSCLRGGLCKQLVVAGSGQLDLLFMIDNSGSMREEQAALVREMPRLIGVLTSGDLDGDGTQDFPVVRDLHVGVVSSSMGIGGATGIDRCSDLGDDGVLLNTPSPTVTGCATSYPRFLSYDASQVDPNQAATDFACIGTLGTDGCGFEQQLEAVLKAVTPSSSDLRFLPPPTAAAAVPGHADGVNAGFLREESLVALVLVTDEEDCSAREPRLFWPSYLLDPNDPLAAQDLNLRCFYNKANLFDVERYVNGLQELRPPGSNLVLFAAIVGVPPELVDRDVRADVDFADSTERDAYYDAILDAPAMQEVPDPAAIPGGGSLLPSCETANGRAYPPRRIVEVAKGFGANAVVQSICQDSFAPALEPIVERISQSLTAGCLEQAFERDAGGLVACDVIWELPAPGTPGASLQICEELPYLHTPEDRDLRQAAGGRSRCVLHQVSVTSDSAPENSESGWYYDDFSSEATDQCGGAAHQRVVFTDDVSAPADVRVFVDCAL